MVCLTLSFPLILFFFWEDWGTTGNQEYLLKFFRQMSCQKAIWKLRWMMSLKCIKYAGGFNVISIQLGYSGNKKLVIYLVTSSLAVQGGPWLVFQKLITMFNLDDGLPNSICSRRPILTGTGGNDWSIAYFKVREVLRDAKCVLM